MLLQCYRLVIFLLEIKKLSFTTSAHAQSACAHVCIELGVATSASASDKLSAPLSLHWYILCHWWVSH